MEGKNDYKPLLLNIFDLMDEDIITSSGIGDSTVGEWNDGNDDTAKSFWN